MVSRYADPMAIAGMPGVGEQTPIDPAFAENFPASTQLLIWDANFRQDYDLLIETLNLYGPLAQSVLDIALAQVDPDDLYYEDEILMYEVLSRV